METLIIIIALPGAFLVAAWFVRGTQGGLQRGTRYFFSGLGRKGGQAIAGLGKGGAYLFSNRAAIARALRILFSPLAFILRRGGEKIQEKRILIAEKRDSTHEIQDVIVNIEDMLEVIDKSLFYVELRKIEKNYRYFKREYKFFRDSPLFKKRSVKRVQELNAELKRLLAMAENIEENLARLYREQDIAGDSEQHYEYDYE